MLGYALKRGIGMLAVALLLAAWPTVIGIPSALAEDLSFRWLEGVVQRVDSSSREIDLVDFQSGVTASGLQVQGSVDLRQFKVGDHVLAQVGVNNSLILQIRKVHKQVR